MSEPNHETIEIAREYYNSEDADNFYFRIWGGEDIHVGLYDEGTSIRDASRRTVERMAQKVSLSADMTVFDLGAGYGGAARQLARNYGCHVICLNLSERENERNREMNEAQGLEDKIKVLDGPFERVPQDDASVDVCWSEDAFLHSPERKGVLKEAFRILKPGGGLIFTDPMQADDVPEGVLQPVYDRIHLDSLASFAFYKQAAAEIGFEEVDIEDLTPQLTRHYTRVGEELRARRGELQGEVSDAYIDRMLTGLNHWVEAGAQGYLAWGILHFRKPA